MSNPLELVMLERARQDRKWGEQNHGDEIWYMILAEEMGELAKALLPAVAGQEGNAAKELVEVAAVALAWLEAIERRTPEVGERRMGGSRVDEGYKAARGAIPWEPGMLSPEDAIRKVRGRVEDMDAYDALLAENAALRAELAQLKKALQWCFSRMVRPSTSLGEDSRRYIEEETAAYAVLKLPHSTAALDRLKALELAATLLRDMPKKFEGSAAAERWLLHRNEVLGLLEAGSTPDKEGA